MPMPIVPLHVQESHQGLFDLSGDSLDFNHQSQGLSALQMLFLGDNTSRTAAKKFSETTVSLLDDIYKSENEDDVLSFAMGYGTKTANTTDESTRVFLVPKKISDNELLGLKTQGLVSGSGRAITFTPLGRHALRDKWLVRPNALVETRKKKQFDLQAERQRMADTKPKMTRIASNSSVFTRVPDTEKNECMAEFQLHVNRVSSVAKNSRISTAEVYESVDIACELADDGDFIRAHAALDYIENNLRLAELGDIPRCMECGHDGSQRPVTKYILMDKGGHKSEEVLCGRCLGKSKRDGYRVVSRVESVAIPDEENSIARDQMRKIREDYDRKYIYPSHPKYEDDDTLAIESRMV